MKLVLKNANDNRNRIVEVDIHDKVKITEWDGIVVEGVIKSIEKNENSVEEIVVHHARFIGGCYDCMDYSILERESTFTFRADNLFEMKVAKLEEEITPLSLVNSAVDENYCGSEEIVMSPLFFEMYRQYMQKRCDYYCQYPIRVDQSLSGYAVVATPTENSKKHKITPMECYTISFYQLGKWKGSNVFSAFNEDVQGEIDDSITKFKRSTGIEKAAYRLCINRNTVVKRGVI